MPAPTLSHPRPQDKNPSPLNQLDFLMEETYNSLMEAGALMETAQAQVASASIKLGCVVQLMLQLIEWVARVVGCGPPTNCSAVG